MKKQIKYVLLLWASVVYSQDNYFDTIPLDYLLYNDITTLCHFEKTQNPGFITNVDDNERCFGKACFNYVHFLGYHFFSLPIFDIKSYIREIIDAQAELILEVEHSKISYRESYHVILIIPDSLEINELNHTLQKFTSLTS